MYYVYLLKSTKVENWIYVGLTKDLKSRFKQHQLGKVFSTNYYKLFVLIYYEAFLSEKDAREREKQLKQHGNSLKFLKKRIKNSIELNSV